MLTPYEKKKLEALTDKQLLIEIIDKLSDLKEILGILADIEDKLDKLKD